MLEKIIAKLKVNRGNTSVSDRTLEEQARVLSTFITTDEILETFDAKSYVDTLGGNISKDVSDAVKSMQDKKDSEKADEAARIAAEEAKKKLEQENNGQQSTVSPEITALIEQNKQIQETLAALKGEKITSSRIDVLNKSLENVLPSFSKPIISSFGKMNFESDQDFNDYVKEVEKQRDEFNQESKERGMNTAFPKGDVHKDDTDKELNPVFKKALDARDEANKSN